MDRQIEFADLLSIVSLYLAIRNLSEMASILQNSGTQKKRQKKQVYAIPV